MPSFVAVNRAVISLGSNVGNRVTQLKNAAASIAKLGISIEGSHLYETEPWGFEDQPRFLNAVISLETSLEPQELLHKLQSIESDLGRTKTVKWGPRIIDLDIILYESRTIEEESLKIPHPHFSDRLFVLLPLSELNEGSQLVKETLGESVNSLIAPLKNEGVVKTDERLI